METARPVVPNREYAQNPLHDVRKGRSLCGPDYEVHVIIHDAEVHDGERETSLRLLQDLEEQVLDSVRAQYELAPVSAGDYMVGSAGHDFSA
jgi:hypothetical protein